MKKAESSNSKFYSMLAFDNLTEWLNAGGYEKKNRILQAISVCDRDKMEMYVDDYLAFLNELIQGDLNKAYECAKYVWIQASAVATQNGLNDWTINIINYKYYPVLSDAVCSDAVLAICKQILLEYADAVYVYNNEKNYSPFIRDICRYIKESLPNSLTISKIAKAHNFSDSYISHCFKKETGMSIGKYIMNEKITLAKDMISEGISFLEIANKLDFSSQSHFSRQFKKITNMTPNEYKNRMNEKDI